ncbi:MAG: hypothetical protein K8T25_09325, partial [Planctomycetia bacterium]|nr:hypothetical protein [Planctomycetia bacterium]
MSVATKDPISRSQGEIPSDVPKPIIERLQSLKQRIRRVILLRGLLGVGAGAVAVVLLLMAIDASVMIEATTTRVLLSVAGFALIALAALIFIFRPLSRRLSLTTVARMVEEHHPELQERISSAFELLSSPSDSRSSRGSEQLIAALAAEATLDVRNVDPRREVGTRSMRPYLIVMGSLLAILAVVFVLWPRQSSYLLGRVFVPQRNTGNMQAMSLKVDPEKDIVVAIGTPLTVSVLSEAGPLSDPRVRHIDSTGRETVDRMSPVPGAQVGPTYSFRYESVLEDFTFRVQAGNALTRF